MTRIKWQVFVALCLSIALTVPIKPAAAEEKPVCYTARQMENVRLVQSIVGSGQTASYKTNGKPKFEYLRTVISDDYVADLSSGMPYGRQFRGWQGYQDLSAEI